MEGPIPCGLDPSTLVPGLGQAGLEEVGGTGHSCAGAGGEGSTQAPGPTGDFTGGLPL